MEKTTTVYETEVLVVGAGPAGCATALSLLNYSDTQVMLVEQGDLSQVRVGEQVSATIFKFFDYLKLTEEDFNPNDYMPSYSSVSYWGSHRPSTRNSIFTTEEANYQLNREAFDLSLLSKVSTLGGTVLPRTKVQSIRHCSDGRWELELLHAEQGPLRILAKYLVDATGRNASISRQLEVEVQKHDKLMGLGCFFSLPKGHQQDYGHVLESCEDGWWYCAQLPDNQMVVSLFSDADIVSNKRLNLKQHWLDALARTQHITDSLQGATLSADKLWVRNACSQLVSGKLPNNFLAVGDAACAFDPISSMGIGFALSSGCQAAITIIHHEGDSSDEAFALYQQDLQHIFDDYLATRQTIYDKEQRWLESAFWRRRGFSMVPSE